MLISALAAVLILLSLSVSVFFLKKKQATRKKKKGYVAHISLILSPSKHFQSSFIYDYNSAVIHNP